MSQQTFSLRAKSKQSFDFNLSQGGDLNFKVKWGGQNNFPYYSLVRARKNLASQKSTQPQQK